METTHYVYALLDALDIEVYIGKTNNPVARLQTHHNCPCSDAMRAAIYDGCRFRMKILSEHRTAAEALDEETRQIEARKDSYLLNVGKNYERQPKSTGRLSPTRRWWLERMREDGYPEDIWK